MQQVSAAAMPYRFMTRQSKLLSPGTRMFNLCGPQLPNLDFKGVK